VNIFHFKNTEKLRRFRISVMLLAALIVGAVLEKNIGISLSDRLARRIGTANAQVVSCARSGSELTVTLTGEAASAPFSNFTAQYADGSTESVFSAESNSSAPAPEGGPSKGCSHRLFLPIVDNIVTPYYNK
jgi:hypothetical protein